MFIVQCIILWSLWAAFADRVAKTSPRPGDPLAGLFLLAARLYTHVVHRLRVEGREHIPRSASPDHPGLVGPLIVVCNHTAGVDPLLVQAACPFEIRWMMARDMMTPALQPLWDWGGLIAVDRDNPRGDAGSLREALAHLKGGGVVGIFPEGAIAREEKKPERKRGSFSPLAALTSPPPAPRPPPPASPSLLPFAPGVGLLIHKSRAPVLQAVISGTPRTATAFGSLVRPSRSRVRFLAPLDFASQTHAHMKAAAIAELLRERALRTLSD